MRGKGDDEEWSGYGRGRREGCRRGCREDGEDVDGDPPSDRVDVAFFL